MKPYKAASYNKPLFLQLESKGVKAQTGVSSTVTQLKIFVVRQVEAEGESCHNCYIIIAKPQKDHNM